MALRKLLILCAITLSTVASQSFVVYARNTRNDAGKGPSTSEIGSLESATEKMLTITPTHETISKIITPGYLNIALEGEREIKQKLPQEVMKVRVLPKEVLEKRDVSDKESIVDIKSKRITASKGLNTDKIPAPVYLTSTPKTKGVDIDMERQTIIIKSQTLKTSNNQFKNETSANCETDGERKMDTDQCDAYYECLKGTFVKRLCPEGLVYNPDTYMFNYPCQYPYEISCEGREKRQPAQPTEDCPHQYGYFRIGDEKACDLYRSCVSGHAYDLKCSEGLAFNEAYNKCDWPDQVSNCDPELYLGFKCESETGFFKNDGDCKKYFTCLNGKPRLLKCSKGEAFDSRSGQCVKIKNVDECQ